MTLSRPLVLGLLGLVLIIAAYLGTAGMRSSEGGDPAPSAPKPAPAPSASKPSTPPKEERAAPGRAAGRSTSPSPAAPATDPAFAGLPRPVARALGGRRLVVLILTQPGGADDAKVKTAVRALRPLGVRVFADSVSRVDRYAPITNSVSVAQAPSTVILTPDRRARLIEGYVDPTTLRQILVDTLG